MVSTKCKTDKQTKTTDKVEYVSFEFALNHCTPYTLAVEWILRIIHEGPVQLGFYRVRTYDRWQCG